MNYPGLIQIVFYLLVLTVLSVPLGSYMARVYTGQSTLLGRVLAPVENVLYKLCGINAAEDMSWSKYALAMLVFNGLGLALAYVIQRIQNILPFNPQGLAAVSSDSALNTAISFASNTNWQGYGGETTMSYATQMLALTTQNFVSAASGIAVLVALIRGFTRQESKTIGNFWTDMVKSVLYILLPFSIVLSLALVSQGVVQTFAGYAVISPVDKSVAQELKDKLKIAVGPAASQIAIKQLGTNGGGFFNVNSAHPFENPTPLSNFLELLSILIIPSALCHTFGVMVKDRRQGWAIWAAMTIIFVACLSLCWVSEEYGVPKVASMGAKNISSAFVSTGNMEGKESRFGVANSALWAVATTAASNGSVNSMHDSYTPLGGLSPMLLMQLGEIIYGGVGSGLYGMIVFAIIAVFVAGLMVGRTPEYLGKKIEAYEMKMASLVILIPPIVVLAGTALAVSCQEGRAGVLNSGAHGFSEILYALSSAGNNNGSAFAGLSANTPFYNYLLGVAMFFSRYWLAIPVLAMAGSLGQKKLIPAGLGTMPTHTLLFVTLLVGVVLIFGALTFFPALAVGPIVEHLQMVAGIK
jgi:K+-transporting ATPase ATPase A chain